VQEKVNRDIFVIMGAAVWPGGLPSKAMRRRVEAAVNAARANSTSLFLPSGGIGRHPPAEAVVMRSLLLEHGVSENRIVVESHSKSTLASVINSARIIQSLDVGRVFICTDTYHQLRCRWLFRFMGIDAEYSSIESGRSSAGLLRWTWFYCREAAAIPADSVYCLLFRYMNLPVAGVP
jgi:vancomycin permeability regulator SanA